MLHPVELLLSSTAMLERMVKPGMPMRMELINLHVSCTLVLQAAVDAYGHTDVKLWIRYIQHQQQMAQGSGSLYWRACKQLQDADAFVAAFNSMQTV